MRYYLVTYTLGDQDYPLAVFSSMSSAEEWVSEAKATRGTLGIYEVDANPTFPAQLILSLFG